jgi:hypothetical protein
MSAFHTQSGHKHYPNSDIALVTSAGLDADTPGCMLAESSDESRMAIGIIVNLEVPAGSRRARRGIRPWRTPTAAGAAASSPGLTIASNRAGGVDGTCAI